MSSLALAFADGAVVAKRNLIKIKRVPEILIWTTMSPIMFVVLFAYVFGSSIQIGGGVNYREFLIAGVFAQTVIFGSTFTGAGLAEDMTKGIIDRFRSLPMARSAVLFGRTASDILYNSISIFVMTLAGLIVGWSIRTSPFEAIGGFLLLLLFAYAISWIMAYVGLKVSSVEVVQNASFMFIFPMTFIANTFVRSDFLPGPLRTFAEWNPVSAVAQAVREAFGNTGTLPEPDVWSLAHPVAYTLIWVFIILAIFVPLSVRQYGKAASRAR
jgi:ABC-2 type transport system permease protein